MIETKNDVGVESALEELKTLYDGKIQTFGREVETFVVETNEREGESVSEVIRRVGEGYELSNRGRERRASGERRRGGEVLARESDSAVQRGVGRANERDD
jgi:hypothetical protein